MTGLRRKSWWLSAGLHVVAIAALRHLPAEARELAPEEIVELVVPPAPPPPPPPVPPPPPPPQSEAEPPPAPEPEPEKPATPPPPRQVKAAVKPMPSVATADGPGSANTPVIAGDFGSPEPPPAAAAAPAPTAAKAAAVDEEPKCTEPLVKAKPLEVPQPTMTEAMREAGLAGKVRVELKLDAEGHVKSAKILEGLGSGFDDAALEAARGASFTPASKCGEPVPSTFVLSIRFTL